MLKGNKAKIYESGDFYMLCCIEIPEINVGRFSLCFVYFVLLEDQQKLSVREFDRSIFVQLSYVVFLHFLS